MNEKKIVKVCVPSTGADLKSEIDSRFGRCEYFVLVEIEDNKISNFKSIKNAGGTQSSGAGIAAAEQVSGLGADVVLASDIGPKSKNILDQLEIKIIKTSGNIKKAIDEYIKSII